MNRRRTAMLIGAVVAAGAAFCVGRTVATTQRTRAVGGQPAWLAQASPEAVQAEERFEQLARQQMDVLHAERAVLASMLSDTQFTGEQILDQVEKVMQTHAALAKSVGVHLANLQGILPPLQGQRLMSSCANSLQGSLQRRYRWRGGAQDQGERFMGGRRGRGGWGAGHGRQYRGGRSDSTSGLARRLQLTQEQNTWIQQQDPNFAEQCALLNEKLYEAHASLVASIESAQATEQELATKVDDLIAAHEALETRVAQHIVLLRPQLSQEQRNLLSDLCGARYAEN